MQKNGFVKFLAPVVPLCSSRDSCKESWCQFEKTSDINILVCFSLQLSSMEIGETGRIIRIASGGNLAAELDKHWIKEGNEIRALHRKEPDAHPLMVSVDASRHHIPKGLTEKIFVEVI